MSVTDTDAPLRVESLHLTGEVWRPIFGYEDCYQVSNFGRVKSLERLVPCGHNSFRTVLEKILKPLTKEEGCQGVALQKSGHREDRLVHSLVLEEFIGPCPDNKVCRHLDDNLQNNNLENLEWSDLPRGERIGKLTESQVREIRTATGTHREIAELYGVRQQQVSRIKSGERWAWFEEDERDKIVHGTAIKLTDKEVREILASSETNTALTKKYNVTDGHISNIRAGRTWRHIYLEVFPPKAA